MESKERGKIVHPRHDYAKHPVLRGHAEQQGEVRSGFEVSIAYG